MKQKSIEELGLLDRASGARYNHVSLNQGTYYYCP